VLYVAASLIVVNLLAVLVLARLGRRLSGTSDEPAPQIVVSRITHRREKLHT
jgi:hypothetical protein